MNFFLLFFLSLFIFTICVYRNMKLIFKKYYCQKNIYFKYTVVDGIKEKNIIFKLYND